jgi:hypothetical protein
MKYRRRHVLAITPLCKTADIFAKCTFTTDRISSGLRKFITDQSGVIRKTMDGSAPMPSSNHDN